MKKIYLFIISLIILQGYVYSQSTPQVPEKEYQALVDIYNQMNGAGWGSYYGQKWNITENNLHQTTWSGVTVENGHVRGLDLSYFYNVKGNIPESIGNLEYLKTLGFRTYHSDLDLSGSDLGLLSRLKNLESLTLNYCKITGALPDSWGELQQLTTLNVSYNQITQLPNTLGNMTGLLTVTADHNKITDLPASIGNSNITSLNLDNNQITHLPESIGSSKLVSLKLNNNLLEKINQELENIVSLKTLQAYTNRISEIQGLLPYTVTSYNISNQTITVPELKYTGEDLVLSLPQSFYYNRSKNDFSQIPQLKVYLRGTNVGGYIKASENGTITIPKELLSTIKNGNEVYLHQDSYYQNNTSMGNNYLRFTQITLDLPQVPEKEYQALVDIYNQMNGAGWGSYYGQKWNITENNLHQTTWSGVTVENGHVRGLDLSYFYNVKGNIPESIGNLEYLKTLGFRTYHSDLDLSGSDLGLLSRLKNLESLTLNYCKITGALPDSWGELQQLTTLNVSYNQITQLPNTLGNMTGLLTVTADHNKITGLPASIGNSNITSLNLDTNQITHLPESIGNSNITSLNLDNNQITHLPESIGSSKLVSLKLNNNLLEKINQELENIVSLKTLQAYTNRISEIQGLLPYTVTSYNISNQTITVPELKYTGEDLVLSLPQSFYYNRSKNDFSQIPQLKVFLRGTNVGGYIKASENGTITIPKELLSTIKNGDEVYLYQDSYYQNNTSMGNNYLRFTQITLDLPQVPEKEYQALVDIYNQMNGAGWGSYYGQKWNITENNLHQTTWSGVTVENGHVRGLDLSYFYNVKGNIPESIGNLEYLKTLGFRTYHSDLDLSGSDLGLLSRLKNLESLTLNYCKITGALPDSWGELQQLTTLNVSYNQITQLPNTLGNMTGLLTVTADHNKITDLPASIGNSNITSLNLDNNQITHLPESIGSSKLVSLKLNNNLLEKINQELENIVSLKTLQAYTNRISEIQGLLPYTVTSYNISNQTITVPELKYTGEDLVLSLPQSFYYNRSKNDFSQIPQLKVYLRGTNVGGYIKASENGTITIPKELLSTIKNGNEVYLHQDSYYQNNTSMGNNYLRFTQITLDLPQVPEKEYQALVDIYNQMNGAGWGSVYGQKWNITENNLHQTTWSGVTVENGHVRGLDLSYFYNVKGNIPESIGNLEYLKTLGFRTYHSDLDLSGSDLGLLSRLKNLESLTLSYCKITGALPDSWGELQQLTTLNVSYNQISEIPVSLINLPLSKVNFNNQTITIAELETGTNELVVTLPRLSTFGIKENKPVINSVYFYTIYVNGSKKGSAYSKDGKLVFKDISSWNLKYGDKIRIEQTEGNAIGTNIYYNTLTFGKQVESNEFEILKKLYTSTLGSLWTNKWDISQNNLHLQSWYGVGIKDGHIISISLPKNNLIGTLPEEISGLKYLEILNLGTNEIEGELPVSIGNLEKLQVLNLRSNQLEGVIPSSLSKSRELKKLILPNNKFIGSIPSALLNTFANIDELDLSNNSFTDIEQPLHFVYANLRGQEVYSDEYLKLEEDEITVKLNRINIYDQENSDFNAENTFYLQVNSQNKIKAVAKEGTLVFSDINIADIPEDATIAIWQLDGTTSGSYLRYKGILRQSSVPLLEEEYQALLKLYQKTDGTQWKEKWDISSNNLHETSWKGITHNEGHIIDINLSDNNLEGIIPKEIAELPKLKSINLSSNKLYDIEKVFPSAVSVALDRQQIDLGELPLSLNTILHDRPLNRYDHSSGKFINQTYSLTIGNFSKNITIPEEGIKLVDLIQEWNISNNEIINLRQTTGTSRFSNLKYKLTFNQGDANLDELVNILDIQTIINYLQSKKLKYFNYTASDMNNDSSINLLDVLLLVNEIQKETIKKTVSEKQRIAKTDATTWLSIEDGILYIENPEQTISSFDIRLQGIKAEEIKDIITLDNFIVKISQNRDEISLIGFSPTGELSFGKHPIASVLFDTKITSGLLSNEKAEEVPFIIRGKGFGGETETDQKTNGVFNVPNPFTDKTLFRYNLPESSENVQLKIYDLQGRLIRVEKNLPIFQGNQQFTFFRKELSSGMYFYIMEIKYKKSLKTYKGKMLIN